MNTLIVGRGKVGTALWRALQQSELDVRLSARNPSQRQLKWANCIVLAVPDAEIRAVAANLGQTLNAERRRSAPLVLLHCAGSLDSSELQACRAHAHLGVMHPMVSFATKAKQGTAQLSGTVFTCHGDRVAVTSARTIAKAVGASAVVATVETGAYHAAAALVANGSAALCFAGANILTRLGFSQTQAERALGGLLRSVADNIEHVGVPQSLTGPVVRGDVQTVGTHQKALRRIGRRAASNYDAVGPIIVQAALAAGLPAAKARALRRKFRK